MPKVKFTTEEILVCPKCNSKVDPCEKCGADLCIELGCKFDGYCIDGEHFCLECGEKKQ
jgi:hypothetical protein